MQNNRRTKPFQEANLTLLTPIMRLWILRILVPLHGKDKFIDDYRLSHSDIAAELGLGHFMERDDYEPAKAHAEIRELHRRAEKTDGNATVSEGLQQNVQRLAALVGLTEPECRILEFTATIHSEQLLDDAADWLGRINFQRLHHVMSVILDLTKQNVCEALSPSSALIKSGLLTIDLKQSATLTRKLDLISENLAEWLLIPNTDPATLLRNMVRLAPKPSLQLSDYAHIDKPLGVLKPYLANAVHTSRKGVNIYIYGDPGTGKSELAKVLASELDCELYEISCEDMDGDPVEGERRLRALRAAQSFFARRRALIVFDEVEDVFSNGSTFWDRQSTAQTRKAWINRMLEENVVPVLWLSNSIDSLDPAFMRRYDMILELTIPSRRQRRDIVKQASEGMLNEAAIERFSSSEQLAPAVVTRAASVVKSIRNDLTETGAMKAMELLINNTLQAQGHRPIKDTDLNGLPGHYDPAYLNADADMRAIAEGLARNKSGRICLYGPPGTGKTAYGRWLAEQLELPLMVRRASDLISKWVGATEKNIARAFQEAESDGALLLIDEVDGFLQDRRKAQQSWEVTAVNEMLTQMEAYPGIFIASTNLMEGLDQAALRRFDLKLRLSYLQPTQAWALFEQQCDTMALPQPRASLASDLALLTNLTPGDFAMCARRHRFMPLTDAGGLLAALQSESLIKEDGVHRSVGFLG